MEHCKIYDKYNFLISKQVSLGSVSESMETIAIGFFVSIMFPILILGAEWTIILIKIPKIKYKIYPFSGLIVLFFAFLYGYILAILGFYFYYLIHRRNMIKNFDRRMQMLTHSWERLTRLMSMQKKSLNTRNWWMKLHTT